MRTSYVKQIVAAAGLSVALASCANLQRIEHAERAADERTNEAVAALGALAGGQQQSKYLTVENSEQYVSAKRVVVERERLPACNIGFGPNAPMDLLQFGQQVAKTCGVVVRVTPDAITAVERAPGGNSAAPPAALAGITLPPSLAGNSGSVSRVVDIRYQGDVTGLLDAVTSRLGLSWRYRNRVVEIFYLDSRTYHIYAIPTRNRSDQVVTSGTQTSAGISNGSGGSSSSSGSSGGVSGQSGSTQTITTSMDANLGDDLPKAIESMLTPGLGRMFLVPSTQTLTVTDTPDALDRIGAYVDDLNHFATKAVLLNVKVVNVSTNDSDEIGIDWSLLYADLSNSYNVGLVSGFNASADAVSGSVNILDGSRLNGSSLILKALAKQGQVSVLTEPSVTTLNMEAVPIQVAKQTSFLASVEISQTANVGTNSALTPGTVTTGFNMSLLPYILPDDETILLSYSVNLSTLDSIRRVESGGSAIEIPEVNNRIFAQKVRIQTGQTLVLSGFEQLTDEVDRSGIGSSKFFGLGGGASRRQQRDVLVVMITPIVMP